MEALQRHRTDCTIDADLRALDRSRFGHPPGSSSPKARPRPCAASTTCRRSASTARGVTTIRVVAPKIYRPEIRDRLLRLVQMVALRGRYAHPVIQVVESDPGPSPVGTIKVAMGLAGELRGMVAGMPDAASSQPLTMMMQEPGSLGSTLVVSGPTWQDLDTAIGIVGAQAVNTANVAARHARHGRLALARDPDRVRRSILPLCRSGRADAGILRAPPEGRIRHQPAFGFLCDRIWRGDPASRCGLYRRRPAGQPHQRVRERHDQHADDDHQAGRHRPASYRSGCLSGTSNPASTTSPSRRFCCTDADERCAPGETLSESNRFVLFDTSTLEFPTYGRIGRVPDLAVIEHGQLPGPRPSDDHRPGAARRR